jgi:hypothetical protein
MQLPHTTCPGCQEEVFLDELVGGKCPLCGCSLEEFGDAFPECEGLLDRGDLVWLIFNYFVFKKFTDLGVPPYQVLDLMAVYEQKAQMPKEEWGPTGFVLEVPFRWTDRIRPKRCAKCHRLFLFGGHKRLHGDMQRTDTWFEYTCDRC